MPYYLLQGTYSPEAWAAQLQHPRDVLEVARPVLERLGARFASAYYAFGEYDIIGIMEAPDTVSAASLSLVVTAGGGLKAVKTTPLLTMEEGLDAMHKAAEAAMVYRPPKG